MRGTKKQRNYHAKSFWIAFTRVAAINSWVKAATWFGG